MANKKKNIILIIERNSHVREFLKREMTAEGYLVKSAENGKEMLEIIYNNQPPDLLILDPDFPDADAGLLLEDLQDKIPGLPVVLHTFPLDYAEYSKILKNAVFVEKMGSSVVQLKRVISHILGKRADGE